MLDDELQSEPVRSAPVTTLAAVLAVLRANEPAIRAYGATALYLFGSAARDELTPDSDVDVFIDYDANGPFSFVEWIRLEHFLERMMGRAVDFTSRYALHPRFSSHIEQEAIRVF
jgi:uncharacterized protein